MTAALAATRAISAQLGSETEVRSLQELHDVNDEKRQGVAG